MRKLSKGFVLLTALGLVVTAVGCATQNRPEESRQRDMGTQQVRYQDRTDPGRTQVAQNMRVADNVAESVTRLDSVDSATVMVTDRTAYVGVMMEKDYNGRLTNKVKDQVSKRVRRVDPSIDRVFVSANPDFVKQLGDYARDVRNGRPVSGLMQQFSDLVERTFPAAR
ncbi:YhcN/YlaJ family sporulation lipoprotein [Melghirimyces profundicolus]|uniref:YhcN/YlaJ family sporulation lipoprotein n=1 Tax=Melghirimyces profundicolus TaxID=1242148 RepID=A0A2T6C9H5_9BACL|nr:YhcN/YlaJ family sporulation lipoprotein [Melghirimyces profundicolus]PTX64933.1 YhcN/YlaJ family sporulation lipoprotein [Melghirimyces profundicolus]